MNDFCAGTDAVIGVTTSILLIVIAIIIIIVVVNFIKTRKRIRKGNSELHTGHNSQESNIDQSL